MNSKRYIITENQYKKLIKLKRDENVAKRIAEEIFVAKNKLNENKILVSALTSIVEKYQKRGYINDNVVNKLNAMNIKIKGII